MCALGRGWGCRGHDQDVGRHGGTGYLQHEGCMTRWAGGARPASALGDRGTVEGDTRKFLSVIEAYVLDFGKLKVIPAGFRARRRPRRKFVEILTRLEP